MQARRRVLSIATLYPNSLNPQFGTFVARQMEALAARGDWDVTVINPIGIPPIAFGRYRALPRVIGDTVERGVNVYRRRFTLIPRVTTRNPVAIVRAVLPLVRELHRCEPFDLVDAQFFFPDGPAAAAIARELGLPLSIKARGADIHHWVGQKKAREMVLDAGHQATGLLAVSEALAEDMATRGLPRGKITVHYTGLDRQRFNLLGRTNARLALNAEFGENFDPTRRLIASVGALIPRKGQMLVLDALARLPEAELVLVGKGPDEAELRKAAEEPAIAGRVHFLGAINHEMLPLVLSAADVMVLPSASEGLANAWIEALACGTPLVICDAGGAREVVRDVTAGRIVPRDAQAIAQAVHELLEQPLSAKDVAANAARFSWEANAAALAEYYEKLVA